MEKCIDCMHEEEEGYLFPCNQCDGLNNMWQPKTIAQKLADCCITEPQKITAPNFRRVNLCFICKHFMPKLDINYQGRCGKYEFSVEDCETSVCDGFEREK